MTRIWLIFFLAGLLMLGGLTAGCGKKGKLVPKFKVEDEDSGVPLELRLYPPRRHPAGALGVDDALGAMGRPGEITEQDLTPTPPPEDASPEPAPVAPPSEGDE